MVEEIEDNVFCPQTSAGSHTQRRPKHQIVPSMMSANQEVVNRNE
jgi:hypothetical protein